MDSLLFCALRSRRLPVPCSLPPLVDRRFNLPVMHGTYPKDCKSQSARHKKLNLTNYFCCCQSSDPKTCQP
ncbi:hypothetical protein EMIT0158MI4_100316 [Burkholderia ambifaria]